MKESSYMRGLPWCYAVRSIMWLSSCTGVLVNAWSAAALGGQIEVRRLASKVLTRVWVVERGNVSSNGVAALHIRT